MLPLPSSTQRSDGGLIGYLDAFFVNITKRDAGHAFFELACDGHGFSAEIPFIRCGYPRPCLESAYAKKTMVIKKVDSGSSSSKRNSSPTDSSPSFRTSNSAKSLAVEP